jgi:hypothetical protein
MRFYYKYVPDDVDEYLKLEGEIMYLSKLGIIPIKFE